MTSPNERNIDNSKIGYVFTLSEVLQCLEDYYNKKGSCISPKVMHQLKNKKVVWEFYKKIARFTFRRKKTGNAGGHSSNKTRKYLSLNNITGFWYLISRVVEKPDLCRVIKKEASRKRGIKEDTYTKNIRMYERQSVNLDELIYMISILNHDGYMKLKRTDLQAHPRQKRICMQGIVLSEVESVIASQINRSN